MNRLNCINCQTSWPSLPHDQLEQPHNCPACGDELVSMTPQGIETPDAGASGPSLQFKQAA
jgi:rRNA maturation endonuclease Nob1